MKFEVRKNKSEIVVVESHQYKKMQAPVFELEEVQLPSHVEPKQSVSSLADIRYMSSFLVRCGLFSINAELYRPKYREGADVAQFRKELNETSHEIVCMDKNFSIAYQGARLGMDDFDVFQVIANLYYTEGKADSFYISVSRLLAHLKKTDSTSNLQILNASLYRLSHCTFDLNFGSGSYKYWGHLCSVGMSMRENKLCFCFDRNMMEFLSFDFISYQDYTVRRNLGKNLTKWLYNFYSSQSVVQIHTVHTLMGYCGTETDPTHFKFELRKSLEVLKEQGVIVSYEEIKERAVIGVENVKFRVVPIQVRQSKRNNEVYESDMVSPVIKRTTSKKNVSVLPGGKPLT
ncbi:MAG TPA: hypothetical protein VM577_04965 [Anaerovoracaceae bacterium]|nr:hypothetical protein [Anaerovoracaceae bacterium]